jgi:very-short-patch-repair endonuclease
MSHLIVVVCTPRRQLMADRAHLAGVGLGPAAVADLLQKKVLTRVARGVYSPAPLPATARHLISGGVPDHAYVARVRAALLSRGGTAIAGGRTAAVLWGFDMLVEPRKVELVMAGWKSQAVTKDVVVRRLRRAVAVDAEVLGLEPLRVLTPAMTVLDCALTLPLREAVVIADSAMRTRLVSHEELERLAEDLAHHPRGARLRRVLDLVDPEAGSVLESLLRVILRQHGLVPESQVTLEGRDGHRIGRVDFLFRTERLVIECDGRRWHDPEDARERDRVRDNELERAAWRLLRVTWAEVVHHPERVVEIIRDCLVPWPVAA